MKWEEELSIEIEHDVFCSFFAYLYKVINVPKFGSFQYRLLHKAIITNNNLFKCGKVYSPYCSFCGEECETYLHLFIFCPPVIRLMDTFMGKFSGREINSQTDTVISNKLVKSAGNVKNFICLVVKTIYLQAEVSEEAKRVKNFIYSIQNIENT